MTMFGWTLFRSSNGTCAGVTTNVIFTVRPSLSSGFETVPYFFRIVSFLALMVEAGKQNKVLSIYTYCNYKIYLLSSYL